MSTHAVGQFFEILAKDEELRAQLNVANKTRDERIAAAVDLGKKKGFEFTAAECATFVETAAKVQEGALEDAELEAVAGGTMNKDEAASAGLDLLIDWLTPDRDFERTDGTAVAGVRG